MIETDNWPYIAAKYQRQGRSEAVRLIVIHSTESLEVAGGARAVARYFQNPPRKGSSHVVLDDAEIIQCVRDSDTAAGAVGANQDGIHIEQVGKAGQTVAQWDDDYSNAVIRNCANVVAQYSLKYSIPLKRLSVAEIRAGQKGVVGHIDISLAYPGTGHTDPGANYPWDEMLALAAEFREERLKQ